VVTTDGIPLGYEVFAGNRHDSTTLQEIVESMERKYGQANRVWVMDRGMVSEKNLEFLRQRRGHYLVGTPKAMLRQFEEYLTGKEWREVQEGVEVQLVPGPDGKETFILARSADRCEKEKAMHQRFVDRLEAALKKMQASAESGRLRDEAVAHRRLGRLMCQYWRAAGAFEVNQETAKWLDELDDVVARAGAERAAYLLTRLQERALDRGLCCADRKREKLEIGISQSYPALGSWTCTNEQLLADFPDRTAEDIFQRTGIESRQYAGPGETPLTLTVDAARKALAGEGLALGQLDAIICATANPIGVVPSLACLVRYELAKGEPPDSIPCYDILAACSGFLYGLRAAYDSISVQPETKVLLLTMEVGAQRIIDRKDFATAVIFADAATATVVYGPACRHRMKAVVHRPVICGKADDGSTINVPLAGQGFITMSGTKVCFEALRCMSKALAQACDEAGIALEDLDLIIPHQANGRITQALCGALDFPEEKVFNCIRHIGNIGASSLPVALSLLNPQTRYRRIGLCAFGGGLTFGAAVLESC
jgi:3-oxoacyl-(acyl-carrier-protein) synthase III